MGITSREERHNRVRIGGGGGVAERVGVGSAPASPCGLQMLAGLSSANSNLKIYLFRGIKISALFRMSLFAKKISVVNPMKALQ